jgi:hypothetical protein
MLMPTVFRITLLLLVVLTSPVGARFGAVETRDGQRYEGHIRIEASSLVIVNASADLWVQVPLTNLAGLTLENEQEPPNRSFRVASASAGFLPPPWRNEDVGGARTTGGASFAWDKFQIQSSGTNIGARDDSFHFIFKPVRGASEIVGRVWLAQSAGGSAMAGLMMRASLAGDAANVFVGVNPSRRSVVQCRKTPAVGTEEMASADARGTHWIKLKRSGDTFTAFQSRDGRQWTLMQRLELPMNDAMFVGLAATAGHDGVLSRALFDQVEEAPALRNRWFVPRVLLKGGSVASGYVVAMDDSLIRFQDESGLRSVSTDAAVTLSFQFVPDRWSALVASGRPGILLTTGQFIDGECRGISEGIVTVSSIPLGLCQFEINSEVIAVVLRKASATARHEYFVRTADGSVWFASSLEFDGQGVVLREAGLGTRRVSLHNLIEVRRRI